MRFEHPGVLWALLLLAIPIIIHLFHFKRFNTLYFSSLIFVKQIEQETKSVKKLKHLLILISRLLAFAALILAFAKPYIPLSENTLQGKTTAIYIDNSFSMTNLGSEGQLFETAKNEARSIIGQLNDDETFLIVSNDQSAGEQRKYSKAEALQRVNELTVSPFSSTIFEKANWIQTQLPPDLYFRFSCSDVRKRPDLKQKHTALPYSAGCSKKLQHFHRFSVVYQSEFSFEYA